uniref:Uncharacterized protein n=1 Tax=Cucumis melo TaxID=3656 RepID=A0A9I9EIW2_CUCME
MVNNVHLNVDAFHGDKYSGGIHDSTHIVLWKWKEGENQQWKIVPYCKFFLVYTMIIRLSSVGDLYEYDRNSKPLWNKHVWKDRVVQDLRLIPSRGCYIHSLNGDPSISLFLLTKTDSDDDGFLTLKDMIENPFVFYSSVFTEDEMGYYPRHDEFC